VLLFTYELETVRASYLKWLALTVFCKKTVDSFMASPFSSTIRSLEADSFTLSLITTGVSLFILFLWLMWLILGQVTLYETSPMFQVIDEENLMVEFPLDTQIQLQRGQKAQLRLNTTESETTLVPLVVVDIDRTPTKMQVKLYLLPQHNQVHLSPNASGSVEIEASYISPLTLMTRSASKILASPKLPNQ